MQKVTLTQLRLESLVVQKCKKKKLKKKENSILVGGGGGIFAHLV
jgi:hypothetical protein